MRILALTARGTLELCAADCRRLGLPIVRVSEQGVDMDLDPTQLARALVGLRIASRLLVRLGEFAAGDAQELYNGAFDIDWTRWLDATSTFAVHASGDLVPSTPERRGLDHHLFVALRVKDALCDQMVRRLGRRPDVARDDPEVRIVVRGHRGKWAVFLDAAAPPLHERGYRQAQGPAPMKETLAAAVAELAGWDGRGRLHDPMCGSGTLVIEAVNRALAIAPGCTRWFGIERWPHHGQQMHDLLDRERAGGVAHARKALGGARVDVVASDIDPAALIATRANLEAAGLERMVRVEQADATTMPPPPAGTTLVCNPPYGERIGGLEVAAMYAALGRHWRSFEGCTAWLVDGNPDFVPAFGLPFTTAQPMWNGPLAITLRRYELGAS